MSKIKCTFCQEEGNRSKEHLWPKWLQKHLIGDTKSFFQGTHISYPTLSVVSDRVQSGKSLVFGSVCDTCNNGWMSDLENQFKALFLRIEKDYNHLKNLYKKERVVLAKWSLKTAMMINAGTNYRQIIPNEHYEHLFKYQQIPKNVKIDIGLINSDDKLRWEQSNISFETYSTTKYEDVIDHRFKNDSYVITLQLKNLGIKITHYKNCKENNYSLPEGRENKTVRIWPYKKNPKFNIKNFYTDISSMHVDTMVIK